MGQESLVKGHDKGSLSEVRVTDQRLRETGQRSLVRVNGHWSGQGSRSSQWSRVMIKVHWSEVRSLVRCQKSLVSGQGSLV